LVFDHEIGFSFLLDILPLTTPWRLDRHQYLTEHVFYRQLKSEPIDLDGFSAALIALPGVALEGILAQVPAEWNNEVVSKIQLHLETVSDHAAEFIEEIKKRLA